MQLVREAGSQYNTPDYQLGYGIPNLYHALHAGLSADDFSKNKFKLYPNPATSKIIIELPLNLNEASFQLYTVLGELVFDSFIKNRFSVNVKHLKSGFYIAKIQGKGEVQSYKIIKN
jgi:hypothetical protein